jgi:hypothetical protein
VTVFFTVLGFVLIAIVDLFPLLRKRKTKDVATWLVLFVLAFSVSVLLLLKVPVPSLMVLIGDGLKAIGLSY